MYKIIKSKYQSIPITVKASIWFIMCNVLLKGISFFTAPMFARLLSTDEYGKLSLFASYEQIIIIFATWEVGLSPFQRGLLKFKENKNLLKSVVILFGMILSLIVGSLIVLFNKFIAEFTQIPFWLIAIIILYTFLYTVYVSWMTENKLNYKYKQVTIMTVSMTVIQIVSALIAVCFISATAEIKLLFTLIPSIFVFLFLTIKRLNFSLLFINKEKTKEQLKFLISFTWPLVIHSLSYLVLGQADRIMIGKMVSNSAAGLYSVSYTIASVVIIVQSGVLQVLTPWVYHQMDEKKYTDIRKKIFSILIFVSTLYVIFMLIAPDVIIFLYPKYYWNGIWCIPPISMGVYFMFMYSLFVAIEECMDQTKYVAMVSIVCALFNVMLNYFGIKVFGYIACAYTTLLCYIFFAFGHYFFMNKITKKELDGVKIYDGKVFLLVSIIMLCLMIVITLCYNYRIIRYSIVILIICLSVIFRNKYLLLIKELKNKNGGNEND